MTLPVRLHDSLSRKEDEKGVTLQTQKYRADKQQERLKWGKNRGEDEKTRRYYPSISLSSAFPRPLFLSPSPVVRHSSSAERSRRRATTTCM